VKTQINLSNPSWGQHRSGGLSISFYCKNRSVADRADTSRHESIVHYCGPTFLLSVSQHGDCIRFALGNPADGSQPIYDWEVVHFTTPVSLSWTRYWYFFSRNYGPEDRELDGKIRGMIDAGFQEDRVAIEMVQAMHELDRHAFRDVHFRSDSPGVTMRRIVANMARREQACIIMDYGKTRMMTQGVA
jgi:hypothetical protein